MKKEENGEPEEAGAGCQQSNRDLSPLNIHHLHGTLKVFLFKNTIN